MVKPWFEPSSLRSQTYDLPNISSGERAGQATHLQGVFEAQHHQSTGRKKGKFHLGLKKGDIWRSTKRAFRKIRQCDLCESAFFLGCGQNLRV